MFCDLEVAFERLGIVGRMAERVKISISEAFTNALTHGNNYDPQKRIILTLSVNPEEVLADIEDEGEGGLAKISKRKSPTPMDEDGRGINLIKQYATNVDTLATPSGGLLLHMRFARKTGKSVRI